MRAASVLLTVIAVASAPAASARLAEGPVRLGQTAYVGGPRVTPLRVIEDSRCPMNARCVWAGRVVLRVRVTGGDWSRSIDLTMGRPARVSDGTLTLVTVTPDRIAGARPYPRRMRFSFDFHGGL